MSKTANTPINLAQSAVFQSVINGGAKYQNAGETQLKQPASETHGQKFDTFRKTDTGYELEVSNVIKPFDIIARNPEPIGKTPDGQDVYNEWLIDRDVVIKNYQS